MIITGSLLFLSESVKCYYSNPFWIKMGALALAIVFTFTARKRVIWGNEERTALIWGRLAAVTSIVLWGTVAWEDVGLVSRGNKNSKKREGLRVKG